MSNETINRLQTLKRCLEVARDTDHGPLKCDFTKGMSAGYSGAVDLIANEIQAIQDGMALEAKEELLTTKDLVADQPA